MLPTTADTIRSAAKAHNVEYPEAAAEIDEGVPKILVTMQNADSRGWRVAVSIDAGVEKDGWVSSGVIETATISRRDGRHSRVETTRRWLRSRLSADVPVEYREVRR